MKYQAIKLYLCKGEQYFHDDARKKTFYVAASNNVIEFILYMVSEVIAEQNSVQYLFTER